MEMIRFEGVRYQYPGCENLALQDVNVSVSAGQKIAVLGRNGSGKSTLFLHCNGILKPAGGVVYYRGQPLQYGRAALTALRSQVGIVFQHPDNQLFSASVYQDISFGPLNLGVSKAQAAQAVQQAAELCEITGLLDRPTHALSGGEKSRVALAGVLAMSPELLIADEPTSSLDPWMSRQLFNIFNKLVQQGKTIMLATHQIEIARHWADWVLVMDKGTVLAADKPEKIFENHRLMEQTKLNEPLF